MEERPFENMNVIPFVDIMLVLFTIVLTTSTFIASGRIPVNLPQASKNAADTSKAVVIELSLAGGIYFNGAMVTQDSLKDRLMPLDRGTTILVRADRDITLQRFVDVADTLKQLNFTRVAVQTKDRT